MENIKLDYSIQSIEERKKLVEEIVAQNDNLTPRYLEILADYLVFCMEKSEKKEKKILTENRMVTVNKREKSYEGLASQFEVGEDNIYNLINENNKNDIFHPKIGITQHDIEEIPFLAQLREGIQLCERLLKKAKGKDAFILKQALIEMRREQYIIKGAYKKTIVPKISPKVHPVVLLEDYQWINKRTGGVGYGGMTLLDQEVCRAILNNYSKLKQEAYQSFDKDLYYLLLDFDEMSTKALEKEPAFKRIMELRIDGYSNGEISKIINKDFNLDYSTEYISNIWSKKIPRIIAEAAEEDWLDWYYLVVEKGKYKRCNRCGKVKLATNRYFSKNNCSKDGWYSICKECRNKSHQEKKKLGKNK